MSTRTYCYLLCVGLLGWLLGGCSEHPLEDEISLEDAAKLYIAESAVGTGIYGNDFLRTDTLTTTAPQVSTVPIQWTAHWDFLAHSYPAIDFDTTTYRGVPGIRSADMTIWDTALVTISLIVDVDSVIEKTNRTLAKTGAFLVQLGTYGDPYHGWLISRAAARKFDGPGGISPSFVYATFRSLGRTWNPSANLFDVDDVAELAKGDSVTVRVATIDTTDVLFLNTIDGGTPVRRLMVYDPVRYEYVSGWRVSTKAAVGYYYQAFVEAYSRNTLAVPDSAYVGAAGQSFVYRIE